jgi:hypothetical protein
VRNAWGYYWEGRVKKTKRKAKRISTRSALRRPQPHDRRRSPKRGHEGVGTGQHSVGPYKTLPRKALPMDSRCDEAWFYCNERSLDLYVGLPNACAIVVRIQRASMPKEWGGAGVPVGRK